MKNRLASKKSEANVVQAIVLGLRSHQRIVDLCSLALRPTWKVCDDE